jgi:hypothetical protein
MMHGASVPICSVTPAAAHKDDASAANTALQQAREQISLLTCRQAAAFSSEDALRCFESPLHCSEHLI